MCYLLVVKMLLVDRFQIILNTNSFDFILIINLVVFRAEVAFLSYFKVVNADDLLVVNSHN